MAPSSKAKRRKSVPSAMEKAMDEAARQKQKKKRKRGGKKRSLDGADVEAAHERAEQARAVHDMARRAAIASQLERAAGHLEALSRKRSTRSGAEEEEEEGLEFES